MVEITVYAVMLVLSRISDEVSLCIQKDRPASANLSEPKRREDILWSIKGPANIAETKPVLRTTRKNGKKTDALAGSLEC